MVMCSALAELVSVLGPEEAENTWQAAVEHGVQLGRQLGVRQEHARCLAHIRLARACGDVELAFTAIESMASSESMHDKYLAAANTSFRGRLVFDAITGRHATPSGGSA